MRLKLSAIVAVLATTPFLHAQPLVDHVPADSMVYVGWAGTDTAPVGFDGSHFQAILNSCNIRQVFSDFIPKLARRASIANPKVGEEVELALAIVSPMLKHPSAMFVERLDVNDREPAVSAGLICHAGNDVDELERKLAMLKTQLNRSDWFTWQRDGQDISIHLGYLPVGTKDMLADDADFKSSLAQIHADSPVLLYANVDAILKTVETLIAQAKEPQLTQYWPKVRDAIGIDGVKSLAWCSHFEGKNWEDELFIAAPAPRHGLLSIGDVSGKLAADTLACVPATANFVSASTLDLGKGLMLLRDSANAVDPNVGHLMDQAMGGLTLFLGRNFQHDVVEPFGSQWVIYSDPTRNGNGLGSAVLVNRPTDLRKAESGLTTFAIAISNTTAGLMRQYGFSVPLERSKFGQFNVNYLGLPLVTPSWTTAGDRLYLALWPQVAASAAKYGAAPKASILDDANFKAAIDRLHVEQPTGIAYSDLRSGAAESYTSLLMTSRLFFGIADAWGVKAPEPIVPAYEDLVAELEPTSAASWTDDAGFHIKAMSPFPGAEVLNGGNASAILQAVSSASSIVMPFVAERRNFMTQVAPPLMVQPAEPQMP